MFTNTKFEHHECKVLLYTQLFFGDSINSVHHIVQLFIKQHGMGRCTTCRRYQL